MTLRRLALALLALVALPAAAQFGTDQHGTGFRGEFRAAGGAWEERGSGWDRLKLGAAGSGKGLEGLAVRHVVVPVRLQVSANGGWQAWAEKGARVEGSPVTGVRLTALNRSIRYRGTFVGGGERDWVADGETLEGGGAALESLEVELLDTAPKGARSFEYRVFFAGSGFTRWLKAGEVAEGKGDKPVATAVEVRNGPGIRSEVSFLRSGWQPTALEGQPAGDTTGKEQIESLRFFSPVPIRYRVKVEGGGWGEWGDTGATVGTDGRSLRIEAVALELKK